LNQFHKIQLISNSFDVLHFVEAFNNRLYVNGGSFDLAVDSSMSLYNPSYQISKIYAVTEQRRSKLKTRQTRHLEIISKG
jgi:hypothetical protein